MEQFNLESEASYVLGMIDMYSNDKEIESFLKMKGLNEEQVGKVLNCIRYEGYKKRIRQSLNLLLLGLLIIIVLGAIWIQLGGANIYNKNENIVSRVGSRMVVRFLFFGLIFGVIQTFYGLWRYILYSTKLAKND